MVAAILHLQEGAGVAVEMSTICERGLAHAHDVVDAMRSAPPTPKSA